MGLGLFQNENWDFIARLVAAIIVAVSIVIALIT